MILNQHQSIIKKLLDLKFRNKDSIYVLKLILLEYQNII